MSWKNGWTDHDASWGAELGGPRNHILDRCSDPSWEGAILRGRAFRKMHDDNLMWAVQKQLNWSRYYLGYGLSWTHGNVLEGVQRPTWRGNLSGKDMSGHARQHSVVSCVRSTEPIEMQFGLWTLVGRRKHVLHDGHIDTTWRVQLNHPCVMAMWPYIKLLWPLVC